MTKSRIRYSEQFKRQAVSRVTAEPELVSEIALELGLDLSLLYRWRRKFASPPSSPPHVWGGAGGGVDRAGGGVDRAGGGVDRAGGGVDRAEGGVDRADDQRLRQSLLDTAFTLNGAIARSADSAPLNQLTAALGLVIDRLLALEALDPHPSGSAREEIIRIEYLDPDGSVHHSPPWARNDPAFERPIVPGRVQSPFWDDREEEAEELAAGPP